MTDRPRFPSKAITSFMNILTEKAIEASMESPSNPKTPPPSETSLNSKAPTKDSDLDNNLLHTTIP